MPAIAVPNAGELTIEWARPGRTWHNVMGLALAPGLVITPEVRSQIMQAVVDAWVETSPSLRGLLVNEVQIADVRITDLRVVPRPVWSMGTIPFNGESGERMMPPQVTLCVSLGTDHPTRRGRGRLYFSGYGTGNVEGVDSIEPNDECIQQTIEFVEDIRQNLDDSTSGAVKLAVVSYTDVARYEVTSVAVRTRHFATQRRRA
jgi:hypothetical protein